VLESTSVVVGGSLCWYVLIREHSAQHGTSQWSYTRTACPGHMLVCVCKHSLTVSMHACQEPLMGGGDLLLVVWAVGVLEKSINSSLMVHALVSVVSMSRGTTPFRVHHTRWV